MADELSEKVALELARSLKTVEGFSWDADTVQATAEDLVRWCKGGFANNQMWPAESQARWLITQARENWERWKGTAELKALFRSKFETPVKPGNAAIDYANEPCCCGSDKKFRDCCKGKPFPDDLEALRRAPIHPRSKRVQ